MRKGGEIRKGSGWSRWEQLLICDQSVDG